MAIEVYLRKDEPFLRMLKRFTKSVAQSGIKRDLKKRQSYKKPSEEKREKRLESIKRFRKKLAKAEKNRLQRKQKSRGTKQ